MQALLDEGDEVIVPNLVSYTAGAAGGRDVVDILTHAADVSLSYQAHYAAHQKRSIGYNPTGAVMDRKAGIARRRSDRDPTITTAGLRRPAYVPALPGCAAPLGDEQGLCHDRLARAMRWGPAD